MPHASFMRESDYPPEEGLLLRARLHIRGGKRRLEQGRISAGLVTLYDALLAALEWYIESSERRESLKILEGDNLKDDKSIYDILVRSKVLDGRFDYRAFDKLIERAILEEMDGYSYSEILEEIQSVMTQLGIMPFDETALPPEDPSIP